MSRWKVCDSDGDGDGDIGQSDEGLISEHRLSVHAFYLKTGNGRRSGYTGPRGGGNSPTRFTALKLTHYLISPAASFSPPGYVAVTLSSVQHIHPALLEVYHDAKAF